MKKIVYGLCLLISIALNVWFLGSRWGEKQQADSATELKWTKKAALQAEAVAAISCSNHGKVYLDSLTFGGQRACECDDCYTGSDCSIYNSTCVVDVNVGDVLFSEPFWVENKENATVVISSWHRMGYTYPDGTRMSAELEKYICKLHSQVGNAVTDGKYLVYGVGSVQLLNAVIYALSSENSSSPSTVIASVPFYPLFMQQMELFNSKVFEFGGDTNEWIKNHTTNNTDVIEVVTSPNNPDGGLMNQFLPKKALYDHVYYWPHLSPIPAPSDEDIMIFSLSKLTGHAGSRFGWAIIKDKGVYDKVLNYIKLAELGVGRDTQLRAMEALKVLVEGDGRQFFNYSYKIMNERWSRVISVFSKSKRFSIQERQPLYDTFYNITRKPLPGFVWVKCEWEKDEDCTVVLKEEGNIEGEAGSNFLAKERYVRLVITKSQENFDLLMERLTKIISLENGGVKPMRKLK